MLLRPFRPKKDSKTYVPAHDCKRVQDERTFKSDEPLKGLAVEVQLRQGGDFVFVELGEEYRRLG